MTNIPQWMVRKHSDVIGQVKRLEEENERLIDALRLAKNMLYGVHSPSVDKAYEIIDRALHPKEVTNART